MRDPGDYELSGPLLTAGITARAGGGQANGTQLVSSINKVGTCASDGDSVKLPAATAAMVGEQILVMNDTTHALDVFPNTGDNINASSANAAFSVPAAKSAWFILTTFSTVGEWNTVLSA